MTSAIAIMLRSNFARAAAACDSAAAVDHGAQRDCARGERSREDTGTSAAGSVSRAGRSSSVGMRRLSGGGTASGDDDPPGGGESGGGEACAESGDGTTSGVDGAAVGTGAASASAASGAASGAGAASVIDATASPSSDGKASRRTGEKGSAPPFTPRRTRRGGRRLAGATGDAGWPRQMAAASTSHGGISPALPAVSSSLRSMARAPACCSTAMLDSTAPTRDASETIAAWLVCARSKALCAVASQVFIRLTTAATRPACCRSTARSVTACDSSFERTSATASSRAFCSSSCVAWAAVIASLTAPRAASRLICCASTCCAAAACSSDTLSSSARRSDSTERSTSWSI
mmetsp:Transcript_28680/g.96231  ORF Transcript_28680/g.96231 Transcript_28680/m.96231 type:complete len:348 (+) Transcript_28680:411-1454(+)